MAAAAGFPASENSVIACAEEGVDISLHRSQPVSRLLLEESDLILAMEDHHADTIKNFAPDLVQNVELLARFGTEDNPAGGIPDPIGGSLDEYRAARDQIRNEIITALPRIEREILAGVPTGRYNGRRLHPPHVRPSLHIRGKAPAYEMNALCPCALRGWL